MGEELVYVVPSRQVPSPSGNNETKPNKIMISTEQLGKHATDTTITSQLMKC